MKKIQAFLFLITTINCLVIGKPILLRPRYIDDEVVKSYTLCKDISQEVLLKAKGWGRPGIIHGDWIEHINGKSIDLEGNELFPEVEYDSMFEIMPGKYVISHRDIHGLISRQGQLLVPMIYDDVDWLQDGLFCGIKNDGTKDIYTTDGVFLCSLKNPQELFFWYDIANNLIDVHYKQHSSDDKYRFHLFYADGQLACPVFMANSIYAMFSTISVMSNGETYKVEIANPINRWKCLDADKNIQEIVSKDVALNNLWLKRASDYYLGHQYAKAIECLQYYRKFDGMQNVKLAGTSLHALLCEMLMNCYYQTKNYRVIMSGNSKPALVSKYVREFSFSDWGIKVDESSGKFSLKLDEDNYSSDGLPVIRKCLEACEFIYQSSQTAYQNQVNRQERSIQLWTSVFDALRQNQHSSLMQYNRQLTSTPTLQAVPGFTGNIDNSSVGGVPAALLPPSEDEILTSYSHPSSSSGKNPSTADKKERSCTYCKGSGQQEVNRSVFTHGIDTSKKECPICHKMIMGGNSHTHTVCTHCMGTGKAK